MRYYRWILNWGVWTLVGFFFASQIYFYTLYTSRPVAFSKALVWQMLCVYLNALLTPVILWLARRFRIERQNWPRRLTIHVVAGSLIAFALALGHVALDMVFLGRYDKTPVFDLFRMAFGMFDKEMLVYWFLVLMSHAFDYYNRYQHGELRTSQLETKLAQAHLQALRMQLNPHFLFNTLNTISELIYSDPRAAEQMITQVSDMLRLSLDKVGVQEVSLQQELEFLNKYLEIEQTRFAERLKVRMEIHPDTLHACVPNMILQPLVENAVRHGIAPRALGGSIEIHARRDNGMLSMEVRDDGHGLSKKLEKMISGGVGVGLANTRARLEHLYGAMHRFELSTSPGHGLTVSMAIPFRESTAEFDDEDTSLDR
ncbi:MAG TPA: histidine kinase [Pyrinomonadaceae bacterium]|jgi:signal transduction histidine kinase|nr:histidine kinase [Pyrinomonadaceae bacterium]